MGHQPLRFHDNSGRIGGKVKVLHAIDIHPERLFPYVFDKLPEPSPLLVPGHMEGYHVIVDIFFYRIKKRSPVLVHPHIDHLIMPNTIRLLYGACIRPVHDPQVYSYLSDSIGSRSAARFAG